MRAACLQMNMKLGCPEENFSRAGELIRKASECGADVLILPETWNTGFFPKESLDLLSCRDGEEVKTRIAPLAEQCNVAIAAGSVSNLRNGRIYNTAIIFDRCGVCVGEYDKIHLFTPMRENQYYAAGDHLCSFTLDGVRCGVILCYDLRFPELTRRLALDGVEVLFVAAQWPRERISHLHSLAAARAIENQMFVVCCNSCGRAGDTVYGGGSIVFDPLGRMLSCAGEKEEILFAECELEQLADIRERIPVFRDRRPEMY